MAMELERLQIAFEAETKELKKAVEGVKSQLRQANNTTNSELSKMKASYSNFGKSVKSTLGKIFAIAGLAKLGNAAINLASDLEETQNVVDTAFGNMSYKSNEFGKNSILMAGMSEEAAKKIASTHMAMARGMDLPMAKASDMAIQLTQMSGDMASFFNTSSDVADTALRGIWTGETEALKKFGVVMTQTNLEQFMLKNGIRGNIQEMDQASQATLRYAYVMETLNYVSGDFARNSDSWANQTRVLGEQFKQLGAIIGSWLIQALKPLIQFLNMVMSGILKFAQILNAVFGKLFGWNQATNNQQIQSIANQGAMTSGIGKTAAAQDKLGKATEKAGKKAKGALASFDQLNILQKNTNDSNSSSGGSPKSKGGTGGLGGLGNVAGLDFGSTKFDTSGFDASVETIMTKIRGFVDFLKKHKDTIISIAAGIAAGLATMFIIKGINSGSGIFSWLSNLFLSIKNFGVMKTLIAGFNVTWTKLMASLGTIGPIAAIVAIVALLVVAFVKIYQSSKTFRKTVTDAFTMVGGMLSSVWNNVLKPVFDALMIGLGFLWENAILPIWDALKNVLEQLTILLLNLWNNIIGPLLKWLVDVFGPIISTVIGVVILAFSAFGAIVGQVIALIINILAGVVDWLNGVFEADWGAVFGTIVEFTKGLFEGIGEWLGKTWDFLKEVIAWVSDTFGPAFEVAFGVVVDVFKIAFDTISGIVNGILETIGGIINFIVGVFTGDWGKAWEGVKSIFSGVWNTIGSIVSGVWDFILGLFSGGGQIFLGIVGAIGDIFKTIINALLDGINRIIAVPFDTINWVLGGIRDFNIFGAHPFGWIPELPVPQIPKLDVGTNYVAKDGLAMIHEGEAVVPKKYNPIYGGNSQEQIALLSEQNALLRAILDKDTNVYFDGNDVTDNQERNRNRLNLALGRG